MTWNIRVAAFLPSKGRTSSAGCSPCAKRWHSVLVAQLAAEFSFWLAMPTMAGAFAYDLYKSRGQMSMDNTIIVAFGFAVSFVCAWIVVKTFLDYVQRHGLGLFAW